EGCAVSADRLGDVVVNVPVAKMAEGNGPAARDHGLNRSSGLSDEIRHRVYRDRNVVLDRSTLVFLGVRDVLTNEPKGIGMFEARRDGRILDQGVLGAGRKDLLDLQAQPFPCLR